MGTGQAILIDVRSEDEYKQKHLNGAINVPVYNIESISTEITNKDEVILLYCKTGQRSNIAKETLMQNGYRNVYTVRVKIFKTPKLKINMFNKSIFVNNFFRIDIKLL